MCEYKIGFIGAGNIASAIINGITASGYIKTELIHIFDTDTNKTDGLKSKGFIVCESPEVLVSCCDFVFLTVKPQIYEAVLKQNGSCSEATKPFFFTRN